MNPVGKPIPHESADAHVSGEALYTDDLCPRYANTLHAWPVQSPHAHAELLSLDGTDALKIPGVEALLTADDVPAGAENNVGPVVHDEPLFLQPAEQAERRGADPVDPGAEIVFHGQPIAWALGETLEAAKLGAAAVRASYRPLPAILTIDDAIAQDSFSCEPRRIVRGDPDTALAAAPHTLQGELRVGGQEHFYLETQASLATWDAAGEVMIHSSTQHPSETQEVVARVLGLDKNRVTCQSIRMGGAFGGKETQANPWAAVAALGARKTGRPVRARLDRQLDMSMTGKRHPFLARWKVGFDTDGRLLALDLELFSDGGWSSDLSIAILFRALFHCDNAYSIDALRVVGRVCKTHKTSNTAFRGFGGPQAMVVIEDIVAHVARACGAPAHQVRARNFYRDGDQTHYGQDVRDAGRIARIWSELIADSELEARQAEIDAFNAAHTHKKRGLAITPVKFGISFTTSFLNQAGALILLYADGSVQVNHGGTEMGQGLHTKMLQIAAQALGAPLASVRLMPTRTDKIPNTSATAASCGSDLNGAAVKQACEILRDRLADVAGRRLQIPPVDVVFENGQVFPFYARDKGVPLAQITKQAYLERVQLFSAGYYKTPKIHYDEAAGRGKPFHYFTYGASVSEVEVDGFTGQYELRRVDILHDVGDSISPIVDRGQVEGGFVQGVGWLCREELRWSADGRLATRGASTYKLPGLGECPEVFNVRLLPQASEPSVVHGSKAVGEPPLMLAISAREALREAVSAFACDPAQGGPQRIELGCPSTPEAVFWAIETARAGQDAAKQAGEAAQ